jgi:hypothetical protein
MNGSAWIEAVSASMALARAGDAPARKVSRAGTRGLAPGKIEDW